MTHSLFDIVGSLVRVGIFICVALWFVYPGLNQMLSTKTHSLDTVRCLAVNRVSHVLIDLNLESISLTF